MSNTITSERVVECTSALADVWNALGDTDRLNRAVGMKALTVEPLESNSAARFLVRTTLNGFDVTYEESPWEWEALQRFSVTRTMRGGPVALLRLEFLTTAKPDGGTRVNIKLTLEARSVVFTPVVKLSASQSINGLAEAVKELDGQLQRREAVLPSRTGDYEPRLLDAGLAELDRAGYGAIGKRLVDLLRRGADDELLRIRPYVYADEWREKRREVLGACLVAVKSGLLELRWEMVCPSCLTAAEGTDTIAEIGEHSRCQFCDLDFGLDLDESVEATFRPPPSVRKLAQGPFCIGGPARTPHVVAQAILPAKGSLHLSAPVTPGRYRLFARGGDALLIDVEEGGVTELNLPSNPEEWPERGQVVPGAGITLESAEEQARHVKIEKASWPRQAATARDITLLPDFRRFFGKQLLKPGLALKAARITVVFSDLTGSTQLYADEGDADAFRLVLDHFEVLRKAIERRGGTVVKTIGDAVMAAFGDDESAAAAVVDMLADYEVFRESSALRRRTQLKLGLFGGPTYGVTANGILDYFGMTVNLAARLQGEASPGEVVAPLSLLSTLPDAALARLDVVERYQAKLKGVASSMDVARLRVKGLAR